MGIKLESHLSELAKQIEANARRAMKETALGIEADAKANAPVDTGELANSYTTEFPTENSARVGTNVEHAIYQEFGTRFQPGKPHFIPAVEKNRLLFEEKLRHLAD
jgi:HK97 gp10 family phage protein